MLTYSWVFLWSAILLGIAGQALLKAGAIWSASATLQNQLLNPLTMGGLGLYAASSILYIVALRRIPLSVALPCTAVSYIGAGVIGHFVYNEPVTTAHIAAFAVIGFGVALLAVAAR